MKMRYWLASGIALIAIPARHLSAQRPATVAQTSSPRTSITLAEGWRFIQADAAGAEKPSFDDGGWDTVSVPHTWNRVGYYLPDPDRHINRSSNVNKHQGVGWYRLTFTPPPGTVGRRAWLEFDAASRTAEVWLNGVPLGSHHGGYSRFRLDATSALQPGANVLAVKVDNTAPKAGAAGNSFPLVGDFFVPGGLYRPARLVLTDPIHIDMSDYGGPGAYAQTSRISGQAAQVELRTRLRNDGQSPARVTLVSRLIDRTGRPAAEARTNVVLAADGVAEVPQQMTVRHARLWQGIKDPYLYRLGTEVLAHDRRTLDRLEQDFGIRQMSLDPKLGFLLNGQPLKLRGVGMHQDGEQKAWALGEHDVADKLAAVRELGANSIRLTHYQHGSAIHRLADQYGLILWDEIPVVTAWTLGPDQTGAPPELVANAKQQLRELIRQNSNHASVAVWGIANEVDFGPGRPDFLGKPPPSVADPMPLLLALNQLAKAEDPSRPTVLAQCCEERGMPQVPIISVATDAAGANLYYGWYYGQPRDLGPHLDRLHAKRPTQPLALTEFGAGGATTIHTDDPVGGRADVYGGSVQPEEYQSWVHEQSWPLVEARSYLWGTWVWSGFDFASTVRREGDSQDINTKGLITFDGKIKKDAFYYYKANWSTVPTVHIAGRRYTDRAYPVTEVRVYSNAPATELFLNGRSLGIKERCAHGVCVWPRVDLARGENRVTASGRFPSGSLSDVIEWQFAGDAASFNIDAGTLVAPLASVRFGSDAFFSGGAVGTTDKPGGRGRPPQLAAITGTADRDVVATYREGEFAYVLPVPNGRYEVTLTFVEPTAAPGERQFDVKANGEVRLAKLDIAQAAGAPLTSVVRRLAVDVRDGQLKLEFTPLVGKAIVSAVQITRRGQ